MARISIEATLYTDNRFIQLLLLLGSKTLAIGALLEAWTVAQHYWKMNPYGIPKTEWKKQLLRDEIIQCGLAEDRGDFIYVAGSRDHFRWLLNRVEQGRRGGTASAQKRWGKTTPANIVEDFCKQIQANVSKNNPSSSSLKEEDKKLVASVPSARLCLAQAKRQTEAYSEDFELVYKQYPRQEGKRRGYKIYLREIKSDIRRGELVVAIRNYTTQKKGTERQYLLLFSTFMAEWSDWLTLPDSSGGNPRSYYDLLKESDA